MAPTALVQTFRAQTTTVSATGAVGVDVWQTVLRVPATAFTTGSAYVFVITGTVDLDVRSNLSGIGLAYLIPFVGQYPSGTLVTSQGVAGRRSVLSRLPRTERPKGLPFVMLFSVSSWAAGDTLDVLGQAKYSNNLQGEPIEFDVSNLCVQVWNSTALTAAGVDHGVSFPTVPHAIPGGGAAPYSAASFSRVGAAKMWLVWNNACIAPGAEGCAEWANEQTQGLFRHNPAIVSQSNAPTGTNLPVGNVSIANLPGTLWIDNYVRGTGAGTGTAGTIRAAGLFVVEMKTSVFDPILNTGVGPNDVADWWGNGYPWNGALETVTTPELPYHQSRLVIATVAAPPFGTARWGTALELDGIPIEGGLASLVERASQFTCPRIEAGVVALGGGVHTLTFRGGVSISANSVPPPNLLYPAQDLAVYAIKAIAGEVVVLPVFRGPGSEIPLAVPAELSVAVSALPALPFEPTWGVPVESGGTLREFRADRGYDLTHPKGSKSRRRVRLGWALVPTDGATLLAFLEGLASSPQPGCFRWTPRWSMSERAFALGDLATWADDDLGFGTTGPRRYSVDVVEVLT